MGGKLADHHPSFATIGNDRSQLCGAVFIDKNYLLTGAECLAYYWKADKVVIAPNPLKPEKKVSLNIIAKLAHPNYIESKQGYNLAIVKVEDYNQESLGINIQPVQIDEVQNYLPDPNPTKFTAVGAGEVTNFGLLDLEGLTKQVELSYVDFSKCKSQYLPDVTIANDTICADNSQEDGSGTSFRDQGSPLYITKQGKTILVGIADRNWGGSRKNHASLFVNVARHSDWINQTKLRLDNPIEINAENLALFSKLNCDDRVENEDITENNLQLTNFYLINRISEFHFLGTTAIALNPNSKKCEFELPDHGTVTLSLEKNSDQKDVLIAKTANGYWAADSSVKTISFDVDSPQDGMSFGFSVNDRYSNKFFAFVSFADQRWNNGDEVSSLPILTQTTTKIYAFGQNKVTFTTGLNQDGHLEHYIQIEGEKFAQYENKIYKLALNTLKAPDEISATLKMLTNTQAQITIFNHLPYNIFTWALQCDKPFSLRDEYGAVFRSYKKENESIFSLSPHWIQFDHVINKHGIFAKNSMKEFTIKFNSPQDAEELFCELNRHQIPITRM